MFKNLKSQIGFTLIELMVAITIIGILASISVVALQGTKRSARDAERKTDLEDIRSALEIWKADCASYPADAEVPTNGSALQKNCNGAVNTYMSQVPQDPHASNGNFYKYDQLTSSTYILCAYLENGSGSIAQCGTCGASLNCNYKVANP